MAAFPQIEAGVDPSGDILLLLLTILGSARQEALLPTET